MALSLPGKFKAARALTREAKRRGVSTDELGNILTTEETIALTSAGKPKANNAAKWGLVPDVEVSAEPFLNDFEITAALEAARDREWRPAAGLLNSIGSHWERRSQAVFWLAETTAADDDGWLKDWRRARPDDPDALLVHADSLIRRASRMHADEARGVLDQAEAAAEEAAKALPDDPTPWVSAVTMARGLLAGPEKFEFLWRELIARDPHHRQGHDQALQYWCEKWAGSHKQMFAFAVAAAAKTPSLSALPLQAALEKEEDEAGVWKSAPVRKALDVVLRRLDGPGARGLHSGVDRSLAAIALVHNKRHNEAVEQFRLLGPHADAWIWTYFGDPKAGFLAMREKACRGAR
jgi:hypothetical protein